MFLSQGDKNAHNWAWSISSLSKDKMLESGKDLELQQHTWAIHNERGIIMSNWTMTRLQDLENRKTRKMQYVPKERQNANGRDCPAWRWLHTSKLGDQRRSDTVGGLEDVSRYFLLLPRFLTSNQYPCLQTTEAHTHTLKQSSLSLILRSPPQPAMWNVSSSIR